MPEFDDIPEYHLPADGEFDVDNDMLSKWEEWGFILVRYHTNSSGQNSDGQ